MSEREQPDPGDGWRLLEVGERIEPRDEVYCGGGRWVQSSLVGNLVGSASYRRRVFTTAELLDRVTSKPDLVNAPPHYRQGGIECIDAIRAALTPEEFRGFCKGNVIKYAWRERHKGGDADLKKCGDYLNYVKDIKTEATK